MMKEPIDEIYPDASVEIIPEKKNYHKRASSHPQACEHYE